LIEGTLWIRWVALAVLLTLLLAFVRVFRGPAAEDRLLGIQSFGTVGTAVLVLLAETETLPGLTDVALMLSLLAAVTVITFTRVLPGAGESDPREDA
jgi:multicomponent Na+:H+ antiporter subunit F